MPLYLPSATNLRLKLCSADFTPLTLGPDPGGLVVLPYDPLSGASVTWNVLGFFFRVEAVGSSLTAVQIARSTVVGAFFNAGFLNPVAYPIAAGQNENSSVPTLAIASVNSGDKLMPQYTALGTGAKGFTLYITLQAQ